MSIQVGPGAKNAPWQRLQSHEAALSEFLQFLVIAGAGVSLQGLCFLVATFGQLRERSTTKRPIQGRTAGGVVLTEELQLGEGTVAIGGLHKQLSSLRVLTSRLGCMSVHRDLNPPNDESVRVG